MAFRDYKKILQPVEEFGLNYQIVDQLFPNVEPIEPTVTLVRFLQSSAKWALAQETEMMRREAIIAPFLFEAVLRSTLPTVIFSCPSFDVTEKLSGYPDYLLARGENYGLIEAPILAVVEAKRDDFVEGAGQCVAEMVAVREFNMAKKNSVGPVFGCVTNGSDWVFYRLEGSNLIRNINPIYLVEPAKIFGILVAIASGTA